MVYDVFQRTTPNAGFPVVESKISMICGKTVLIPEEYTQFLQDVLSILNLLGVKIPRFLSPNAATINTNDICGKVTCYIRRNPGFRARRKCVSWDQESQNFTLVKFEGLNFVVKRLHVLLVSNSVVRVH